MKMVSSKEVSGSNSLKKLYSASTFRGQSPYFLNLRSYSDNDDESIAGSILNLTNAGSMPASGTPSSVSSSAKIQVRLECCTEDLGSESSDVGVCSHFPNEVKADRILHSKEITDVGVKDSSFVDGGCKGDCVTKKNRYCPAERVGNFRGNGQFPPPLSTLTRGGYPHLRNTPQMSLRPVRKDGRFVLKEVRVPCRDFLRASRKDGRLRLEFVRESVESDCDLSPCKACKEDSLLEGMEKARENLNAIDEHVFLSGGEKTNSKVELNLTEGRTKENEMIKSEITSKNSVQKNPSHQLQMKDSDVTNGGLEEGLLSQGSDDSTELGSTTSSTLVMEHIKSTYNVETNPDSDFEKDQLLNAANGENHNSQETSSHKGNISTLQGFGEKQEKNSKMSAPCGFSEIHDSSKTEIFDGDEEIKGQESSVLDAKSGSVDKAGTDPNIMAATTSTSVSDYQFSFTRIHAGIINNAEALHASCKNGLDGNNWSNAVSPFSRPAAPLLAPS